MTIDSAEALRLISEQLSDESQSSSEINAESEQTDEVIQLEETSDEESTQYEEKEGMEFETSKDGEKWYHNPTVQPRRTCHGELARKIFSEKL